MTESTKRRDGGRPAATGASRAGGRLRRTSRRVAALTLVAGLVAIPASLPALAQAGQATRIDHRQSILTELSATGEPGTSRVFTQLNVIGNGDVELVLPAQSTAGLRNLEGFGRPDVSGDTVTHRVAASSAGTLTRTVADHDGDLPVSIEVAYSLDGEPVQPSRVEGASGRLDVTFTVRNLTARQQDITFFNGQGQPQTESVDVAVPMVGSISTTLDPRFTNVSAPGAAVAGNGRGDTVISYSLLLFAPVGSEEAEFTYSATISDGIVPDATIQVLPVDSRSFGAIRSTQDSYKDVATGLQGLTNGALIVDGNAKLLADGAAQLFDGLEQLADGAGQLNEGLAERAGPGSQQLAEGTGTARAGAGELADGLGRLASGAGDLSNGLGQARSGGSQLSSGLGDLSSGASQLAAGTGQASSGASALADGLNLQIAPGANRLAAGLRNDAAPGARELADGLAGSAAPGARELADGLDGVAVPGAQQLRTGIQGLRAGVGQPNDGQAAGTIIGGVNAVRSGLADQILPGLAGVRAAQTRGCTLPAEIADCGIEQLTRTVAAGQVTMADLGAELATFGTAFEALIQGAGFSASDQCAQVVIGAQALQGAFEEVVPGSQAGAGAIFGAKAALVGDIVPACLSALKAVGSAAGIDQLTAGLQTAVGGLDLVKAGLTNDGCDRAQPQAPANPCRVREVLQLLDAGAGELVVGLQRAATGADDLAVGLAGAADGAGRLATGIEGAAAGAGELAGGIGQAGSGARDLRNGLGQLDDGAGQLAAGAGRARDGSRDLASGLVQLDDGAGQLASGAGDARDGGRRLADGLVQLDDGANQLADGLGDAVDGSGQLAEGAAAAADGGGRVADGTVALSEQGLGAIIGGATDAAQEPSKLFHHLRAVDARGRDGEGLPYGTVDAVGANSTAVYQFQLAGTPSDSGPGAPLRILIALGGFAVSGALGLALRSRLA